MPTLIEFINDVLQKENITGDPDKIAKQIEDIARQRAVNNVAAISDEEVREMVINNAELSLKLAEEERIKKEKEEKEEQARKKEKEELKLQKQLEKERKVVDGEQTSLF